MSPGRRAAQRAATEEKILRAARDLFAREGYERATIRAVAAAAGVDPALVMQYFGSKQDLFTAAVRAAPEAEFDAGAQPLADFLTETVRLKLAESGQQPMVMLRSMLTHPEAAERAREVLGRQTGQLADRLDTGDREVRAAVAICVMLGLRVGRDLLELPELTGAPLEDLLAVVREVFEAITG